MSALSILYEKIVSSGNLSLLIVSQAIVMSRGVYQIKGSRKLDGGKGDGLVFIMGT